MNIVQTNCEHIYTFSKDKVVGIEVCYTVFCLYLLPPSLSAAPFINLDAIFWRLPSVASLVPGFFLIAPEIMEDCLIQCDLNRD